VKTSQRAQQREETRRSLLQAGLRVVSDRGFAAATTADIARETGKAHGTVFLHFPTREALVGEIVEEIGRTLSARLAQIPDDCATTARFLDAHLAALADQEALYARLLSEAAILPPAARARLFALQAGVVWRMNKVLSRDMAEGRARVLDPQSLSTLWIALLSHHLMHRDIFAPDGSVIDRLGDSLKTRFLALLAP
jgi:AcrR family transcriptional regulator